MEKISAVYQVINTITGDRYVGSSKDVERRWAYHKCPSVWEHLNRPLYKDMQKYGIDKFKFQILAPVMEERLREVEQEFIDMLKPAYNQVNASRWTDEKMRAARKKYRQTEKGKAVDRAIAKKYSSQPCSYNGETLRLGTLVMRFVRAGIPHANIEAKKYLIK